jgi:hypothetical protein
VEKVLVEEGSGSEVSKELHSTGSLEAEVEEKDKLEVVVDATHQTAGGSVGTELGEDKQAEVAGEENAEDLKLVEASSLDSLVAEDSSGHEQGDDVNLAETDQVGNQIEAVYEENGDDQTRDDNHVQSGQGMDLIGVVSEESSDDEHEFERSDSIMEEQVESGSLIDKVIEERVEQLEASRKAEKNAEKKLKVSMKPLEWAEELEKRQASFGQHWEEGAAAQPMQLEGIGKGPPAIGYMQIEMDNPVTRAMSSPSFRSDHGSPQVLAVHRSYIAMGTSKGAVIVIPSKYSIHQADDTDAKVSH